MNDNTLPTLRIGHGFDVHAFETGDHIMLGGVHIPHSQQFKAHSDGDVLLHAVCDAMLGAAALGDIGRHFPDTEVQYKNIDSRVLLRHVDELIRQQHYRVANLDVTVVAQAPKLAQHIPAMVQHLADDLQIDKNQVNVKATTTEKLGYTGREEGIAVHAVVLLYKA